MLWHQLVPRHVPHFIMFLRQSPPHHVRGRRGEFLSNPKKHVQWRPSLWDARQSQEADGTRAQVVAFGIRGMRTCCGMSNREVRMLIRGRFAGTNLRWAQCLWLLSPKMNVTQRVSLGAASPSVSSVRAVYQLVARSIGNLTMYTGTRRSGMLIPIMDLFAPLLAATSCQRRRARGFRRTLALQIDASGSIIGARPVKLLANHQAKVVQQAIRKWRAVLIVRLFAQTAGSRSWFVGVTRHRASKSRRQACARAKVETTLAVAAMED